MSPSVTGLDALGVDITPTIKDPISTKSLEVSSPAAAPSKANGNGEAQHTSSLPFRPTPQPAFEIEDHPIDIIKPLKVCNYSHSHFSGILMSADS